LSTQAIQYYSTGKRKNSIARVRLLPGGGEMKLNERSLEEYFGGHEALKMIVRQPFAVTETTERFDVAAILSGGGISAQAGACATASPARCVSSTASCAPSSRRRASSPGTHASRSARSTVSEAHVVGSSSASVNFEPRRRLTPNSRWQRGGAGKARRPPSAAGRAWLPEEAVLV